MSDRDEEEQAANRGFKVEDRRRFSETGEARPDRDEAPAAAVPPPPPEAPELPPATAAESASEHLPVELSFSTFVISLSTQALAHLGEIPDPITRQLAPDLAAARQVIDILGILQQKTKGNLDQAEHQLLEGMLYDLRLRFVERARK